MWLRGLIFSSSAKKQSVSSNSTPGTTPRRSIFATLPYIQVTSDKIRRAFKKTGVSSSFESHKILRQILVSPKEKHPEDQIAGNFYSLNCDDCHKKYIGESARLLGKRIKEHITTRSSSTSAVAEQLKKKKSI